MDVSRIRPEYLDADRQDRSSRVDLLLQEEPDEEEDEEEDDREEDDDDGDNDEGYSE